MEEERERGRHTEREREREKENTHRVDAPRQILRPQCVGKATDIRQRCCCRGALRARASGENATHLVAVVSVYIMRMVEERGHGSECAMCPASLLNLDEIMDVEKTKNTHDRVRGRDRVEECDVLLPRPKKER